jgi:hypothetical protein
MPYLEIDQYSSNDIFVSNSQSILCCVPDRILGGVYLLRRYEYAMVYNGEIA